MHVFISALNSMVHILFTEKHLIPISPCPSMPHLHHHPSYKSEASSSRDYVVWAPHLVDIYSSLQL